MSIFFLVNQLTYSVNGGMNQYDYKIIQEYYDKGYSWRDLNKEFGIASATLTKAVKRGDLISRPASESIKLALQKRPKQKLSEETKKKISESRKKFLEENPDKVPYLMNHYSKGDSYPEKYFESCLINSKFTKKYRIKNYELDFANIESKIDLEIDGEQHFVDKRILTHDQKRNQELSELGWNIVRIRWSLFQKESKENKEKVIDSLINNYKISLDCIYYFDSNINYEKLKFFNEKLQSSFCKCGSPKGKDSKQCLKCSNKSRVQKTKIQWPNPNELQKLIWEKPMTQIAQNLGVSDVAIAKFCKRHNLSKPPRYYWQSKKKLMVGATGHNPVS